MLLLYFSSVFHFQLSFKNSAVQITLFIGYLTLLILLTYACNLPNNNFPHLNDNIWVERGDTIVLSELNKTCYHFKVYSYSKSLQLLQRGLRLK